MIRKLLDDYIIGIVIVAFIVNIVSTFLLPYTVYILPVLALAISVRAYFIVKRERKMSPQPKQHVESPMSPQAEIAPSQRKEFVAVGFSAMNLDRVYQVDRLEADHETTVYEISEHPGGSGVNTIYALGKLGLKVGIIGIVVKDSDGMALLDSLKEFNVDTSHIVTTEPDSAGTIRTGSTIVISDLYGQRSIFVSPGVNNHLSENHFASKGGFEALVEYINHSEFLHLSSFVNTPQLHLQTRLVERINQDVQVSLTPGALYAKLGISALSPLFCRSDIVFLYENQLFDLIRPIFTGELKKANPTKAIESIFNWKRSKGYERETKIVVKVRTAVPSVRKEPPGRFEYALIAMGKTKLEEVCRTAPILPDQKDWQLIDSLGTGDALAAGMLFGLHSGIPFRYAANIGLIMAILVSGHPGARQGLPTLSELEVAHKKYFGTEIGSLM